MERLNYLPIELATDADVAELADVAARTFPLACPPSVKPDAVAAFIAENLTADRFREYLADPSRTVLLARVDDRIAGYALLVDGTPADDPDVQRVVTERPTVELSKLYVLPEQHGSEVSAQLVAAAVEFAIARGAVSMWLGVNQRNERAQRFYAKHGFTRVGTRRFRLGDHWEDDYVLVRPV
ncbi:GNAT family N-acetyltransferase [uncultured Mycolicibacterium sp.]|uniref:GNAT family N-acetyltransferase n=1 Tax=uncultured Mycolicibacterium sp. TaxID=2320817 RepID=UPI00261CABF4|nr:GNAT family N-acetyltransferase [uncultured Mycolicibacterium sp.]